MTQRHVACRLGFDVVATADVVVSVAVAADLPRSDERLHVTADGRDVDVREILDEHGGRLHLLEGLAPGRVEIDYQASIDGPADPPPVTSIDRIRYGRPSRYCESDRLFALARAEFRDLDGQDLLDGITSWVGQRIAYIPGSSRSTDGAITTLLGREGVCRDFAHLVVALLRGCDTPARLVSVYAPGLLPMDFHAVAEAFVDGRWLVADATALAPRSTMVRIATGRDAADTAFLTSTAGEIHLDTVEVTAVVDGRLPADDATVALQLR